MQNTYPPLQTLSIQRHCMQELLHDAISGRQPCCQGLLAGGGNMIEKRLAVTETSHNADHSIADFLGPHPFAGIYISTGEACDADSERIRKLTELVQKIHAQPPACYLLLELGHKGRVDARLFADAELSIPIPLDLQEDGDLYPVTVNR